MTNTLAYYKHFGRNLKKLRPDVKLAEVVVAVAAVVDQLQRSTSASLLFLRRNYVTSAARVADRRDEKRRRTFPISLLAP